MWAVDLKMIKETIEDSEWIANRSEENLNQASFDDI